MPPKYKKVDATIVGAESGEKKSVMFGWCMDGHDEDCAVEFPGHKCSCECHVELIQDVVEED